MPATLQVFFGKLKSRSSAVKSAAGKPPTTLYLLDNATNTRLLVDSGAEVSLFPPSAAERAKGGQGPPLVAANGSPILSFGFKERRLQLNGRIFTWKFILADVPTALLGADFWRAHALLVDLQNTCLVDSKDFSVIKGFLAAPDRQRISLVTTPDRFQQMLRDRPALTTPTFNLKTPAHGVQLYIPTSGPPVFARARRLSPDKLAAAKKEFAEMEKLGIIRRSNSPWASPLHIVGKKDGGHRPCGDFRRLNNVTVPDKYPIPYISDANHFLEGKKIFSKVDLVRGYHQIPVAADDIPKTAVITPFGLYEWVRVPFGLRNAAQAFQRLMDRVGGDLDFIFIYLDDVLIASTTLDEHVKHVETLFDRLEQYGLVVNPDKCIFAVPELEFLGHHISAAGSAPLPEKVEAVAAFPQPSTVLDLMQFTGMVNFYNRFIPKINVTMSPLFAAMAGKKKTESIEWTPQVEEAFAAAKAALSSATMLCHPSLTAPTALTTDASDLGIGAVLEQWVDNAWCPLAFFSKKFRKAELQYSAFDRELLAVHLAVRHFRYFLEGRRFTIFTDHKPLVSALGKVSDPLSARQARHLSAVAEYSTDIRHVQGKLNPVADALSRHAPVADQDPSDFLVSAVSASATDLPALAAAQANDVELQQFFRSYSGDRLELAHVGLPDSPATVICEMSRTAPRPLVPAALRRPIVDQLHGLAHPGSKASVRLVSDRFFWPNLSRDVRSWVSACVPCQRAKIIRHIRPPVEFVPMPGARFDHIHIDVVGPLPPSRGFSYLFTIVDRYTRWPEAIPVADMTTPTLCSALLLNWVARFGVPLQMTSDRGSQFTSDLWSRMSELLGIRINATTAYHPQSNGIVERLHRRLKEALKARLVGPDWFDQLPWILLGLRTTIKQDLHCSPAEMVFGSPISIPGDCLPTAAALPAVDQLHHLHETVDRFRPVPTAHHTPRQPPPLRLLPADTEFVFVRRDGRKPPLSPAYDGPYRVLRMTDKVVTVQMGTKSDTISAERCKAAFVDPDTVPQAPPRRGRPPVQPRHQHQPPQPRPELPVQQRIPQPQQSVPVRPVSPVPQPRPDGRPRREVRPPARFRD